MGYDRKRKNLDRLYVEGGSLLGKRGKAEPAFHTALV